MLTQQEGGVNTISTKPTVQVDDVDTVSATLSCTIRQLMASNTHHQHFVDSTRPFQ